MSYPFLRTTASPPCLPPGIKDSLKEDTRLLMEKDFWMWKAFGCKEAFGDEMLLDGQGFLMGVFG
jgi:hypothetical protein